MVSAGGVTVTSPVERFVVLYSCGMCVSLYELAPSYSRNTLKLFCAAAW
jgi:hypothetical protein